MIKYLICTFGITWGLWGTVILGISLGAWEYGHPLAMTCYVMGIFSPGISAIIVSKKQCTSQEFKAFMKNIINVRMPIKWYIWTIGLPIVMTALPVLWGGATIEKPFYVGFVLIMPMIIGGGLEEIGWRGFLQSKIEARFSVFTSTLIVAGIWAIWHIPLWFIYWTNQAEWNFLMFCVFVTSFSFLLSSVYHKTKSIFLCILCHATINAFLEIYPTNNKILPQIPVLFIAIYILVRATSFLRMKAFLRQ
ncbi:CPBP family intramembrane metalloprotease [Clostridiaceae bacterium M8S5]|nr:CPBP family intramembrane metalloprotease [Clostridiaceae bacterium M8S5]